MTRFKVLKKLQKKFQKIDANGDSMISKSELHSALIQQLGPTISSVDVDSIFRSMDANNDELVSFKEFWNWYRLKATWILQNQTI